MYLKCVCLTVGPIEGISEKREREREREREKGSKNIIQCECVFNEEESGNKKPKSALTFVHHL